MTNVISYSQNQEDIVLFRVFKNLDTGFYIDVGANDPVEDSLTKLFYDRGWCGINIEPDKTYWERLKEDRPRDINLPWALGAFDGETDFYEATIRGWSTSNKELGERYTNENIATKTKTNVYTLNTVLKKYPQDTIHFLKIDVEGAEAEVLAGIDFTKIRPWVLIIESVDPISHEGNYADWESSLLNNGYLFAYFDGLNRYYLAREQKALMPLLMTPPNVLDNYVPYSIVKLEARMMTLSADGKKVLDETLGQLRAEIENNKSLLQEKEKITGQLIQAETQATQYRVQLTEREKRIEELELALEETAQQKVKQLIQAETQATQYRVQLTEREKRIEELGLTLNEAAQQKANLEKKIQDAATELGSLKVKLIQAEIAAKSNEQQLNELIQSRSFRLTLPLRLARREIEKVKKTAFRMLSHIKEKLKEYARKPLKKAVVVINQYPKLKRAINSTLHRFPALNQWLRSAISACNGPHPIATLIREDVLIRSSNGVADKYCLPLPLGVRTLFVFVDHTVMCSTNTGVQRVARGVAKGLIGRGEHIRFVKWEPISGQCVFITLEERQHLSLWNGPAICEDELVVYRPLTEPLTPVSYSLDSQNNWLVVPEVTHITFQQQPITLDVLLWAKKAGLKTGFIFYDAIPLRRTEFVNMKEKHSQYMEQLLLADVVWPISKWSADDLLANWVKHNEAHQNTMTDVQPILLPGESEHCARAQLYTPGEDLILSVGTIEPRKNQVALIHAFEAYREQNQNATWSLVLVGNLHPLAEKEVQRATKKWGESIKHLGHVSDEELDSLYRRCGFTVYPSVEEGFGLPILESLWYGKPCLCADFGAMAEVAESGGCLTVDTRDEVALKKAMIQLIESSELRAELGCAAVSRPITTWQDYAGAIQEKINAAGSVTSKIGKMYFWIDATLQFPKNTGIQRVARQLARGLIESGVALIAVKWDPEHKRFTAVTKDELEYFSRWNGPSADSWAPWVQPDSQAKHDWFMMPELPLNLAESERTGLLAYVRECGLSCAAVFYDAIPWKMRAIYPEHFAMAHKAYMEGLALYDLVLPISQFSKNDLIEFWGGALPRPQGIDDKVKAVELAGEFAESERIRNVTIRKNGPITILCVGTVEPRKNHETLLAAFEKAIEHTGDKLHLVIVGRSTETDVSVRLRKYIDDHPSITWEENADDAKLKALQSECDFTVYPSLEEGFGLPILESLWYGKPCICANFGAMQEVAEGGGCLTVDVRQTEELAAAILQLAEDVALREKLTREAVTRHFKTWAEYAQEVAGRIGAAIEEPTPEINLPDSHELDPRIEAMDLTPRPLLSVCITTYNRAEWLAASLKNWARLIPHPLGEVELLVCDNASTDHTAEVVKAYLNREDFSYRSNPRNVGMLGNLRETAHHARGQYIWIIGDDDLLMPGAVERVLQALHEHRDVALVYLNYAFTRIEDARTVKDFDAFFRDATPIVPAEPDKTGPIRAICARNENFFTAIYTLVFRRDHALRAYTQDTSGRPFSTMLTCIPTTYYVLNHMMEEEGVWIGEPQLVVNMNVSWIKYAPLWILERIPEVYEQAEVRGVTQDEMDRWRCHTLPGVQHYFREIFENDPMNNAAYFSPARLVRRFKHLDEFTAIRSELREIYDRAHAAGHPAAQYSTDSVFPESKNR